MTSHPERRRADLAGQAGNQAALHRLSQPPSQLAPTLRIGAAGDTLEHEADRVADPVMRMTDPQLSLTATPPGLSRKCAACEEDDQARTLQTKPAGGVPAPAFAPPIVHEVLRSSGQPLDPVVRAFFEPRFGRDFSKVRVHTDPMAEESARVVSALAYTVGPDVVFGEGRYVPRSIQNQKLLAHELTHVVQQAPTPHSTRSADDTLFVARSASSRDREAVSCTRISVPGAMVLQTQPHTEDVETQDNGVGDLGTESVEPQADEAAGQASSRVPVTPESGPCNEQLLYTGTGLTGNALGPVILVASFGNAVEIQFRFDFSSSPGFRLFRPVQWAGPEAVWVKSGNPLTAAWKNILSDPKGTGVDDPLPNFVFRGPDIVAFYDSPGPLLTAFGAGNFSRYVAMGNFTASVVGDPMAGGASQRVCQDIAWHSVVSLVNANWNTPDAGQNWGFLSGTEADVGWVDITNPPAI